MSPKCASHKYGIGIIRQGTVAMVGYLGAESKELDTLLTQLFCAPTAKKGVWVVVEGSLHVDTRLVAGAQRSRCMV